MSKSGKKLAVSLMEENLHSIEVQKEYKRCIKLILRKFAFRIIICARMISSRISTIFFV